MPGGSLGDALDRDGPRPLKENLHLLQGTLEGLAAIHARGIVHGDVKPANVLLDARGEPKVADFGLARRQDRTVRAEDFAARAGTPAYMAPEQRAGKRATPASDVYAWGRLAREAIGGPLPPAWERVVAKALSEDPADRWRDAGAVLEALQAEG
jgi:serine/threonine-protein kinase